MCEPVLICDICYEEFPRKAKMVDHKREKVLMHHAGLGKLLGPLVRGE